MVFIEDMGATKKGMDADRNGKTYYFDADEMIKEINKTGEAEISEEADASRLMQEAKEFLSIAKA
jgi:YHS domain-containing protein